MPLQPGEIALQRCYVGLKRLVSFQRQATGGMRLSARLRLYHQSPKGSLLLLILHHQQDVPPYQSRHSGGLPCGSYRRPYTCGNNNGVHNKNNNSPPRTIRPVS